MNGTPARYFDNATRICGVRWPSLISRAPAHHRRATGSSEIAVLKVFPGGREDFRCKRVNPGVPIPVDATAVHGITDDDVASLRSFAVYARAIYEFLADCDFAGFNIRRFDLPLLRAELRRTRGIDFSWRDRAVIDSMTIYHERHPRDLAAAVQRYCRRDFPEAHSAEEDVRATYDVLLAQLDEHADLPSVPEELHRVCNPDDEAWLDLEGRIVWLNGEATLAFGQHSGRSLRDLAAGESSYLEWILASEFDADVKVLVARALQGDFPVRD